jgi:hypothetical protein
MTEIPLGTCHQTARTERRPKAPLTEVDRLEGGEFELRWPSPIDDRALSPGASASRGTSAAFDWHR